MIAPAWLHSPLGVLLNCYHDDCAYSVRYKRAIELVPLHNSGMTVEHLQPSEENYSAILAGQLGYLNPPQEAAFKTFKNNLIKAELYSTNWKDSGEPSHDESTLL